MAGVLSIPTLVLNKQWDVVRVSTVEQAIVKACSGRAKLIAPESMYAYTWDDWLDNFSLPVGEAPEDWDFDFKMIKTPKLQVRAPRVMVFEGYKKYPKIKVRLSRKNVFIRDNFICLYSGKKLSFKDATIDHVIPVDQGGKTTWNNLVTCDKHVNVKKANKTPQEAGLKLIKEPKEPAWHPRYSRYVNDCPEDWNKFIDKSSWDNIEGWEETEMVVG